MRKFALLFLLACSPAWADLPTPVSTADMDAAQRVASAMSVQRDYWTPLNGVEEAVLFARWSVSYGWMTVEYCSITTVADFLALTTGNSIDLLTVLKAPTPHGTLWSWWGIFSPPANINIVCLSQ
jgi:hypothetical protein